MVECQLPKLDVAGSSPVSRSRIKLPYNFVRAKHYTLQFSRDGSSLLHIGLRVNIERNINVVSTLIGSDLVIDLAVAERCVALAYHFEVHPAQADRAQRGTDVLTEQIVSPQGVSPVSEAKTQAVGLGTNCVIDPRPHQRWRAGRQLYHLSLAVHWNVNIASIDPLLDF